MSQFESVPASYPVPSWAADCPPAFLLRCPANGSSVMAAAQRGMLTHHGPEQALAHAVPLAGRPRVLEGGVHAVHLQAHALVQALHKVGVPRGEERHRQDAYRQRAIVAPAACNHNFLDSIINLAGSQHLCRTVSLTLQDGFSCTEQVMPV